MVEAVRLGGLVLDLQVIRPNPIVEADNEFVCEIDGEPLFRTADAATAAINALVATGHLLEQATDDHDVREHYANGPDLIDASSTNADDSPPKRSPPSASLPARASCASAADCAACRCLTRDRQRGAAGG
jgi:hypothetical protein